MQSAHPPKVSENLVRGISGLVSSNVSPNYLYRLYPTAIYQRIHYLLYGYNCRSMLSVSQDFMVL